MTRLAPLVIRGPNRPRITERPRVQLCRASKTTNMETRATGVGSKRTATHEHAPSSACPEIIGCMPNAPDVQPSRAQASYRLLSEPGWSAPS